MKTNKSIYSTPSTEVQHFESRIILGPGSPAVVPVELGEPGSGMSGD